MPNFRCKRHLARTAVRGGHSLCIAGTPGHATAFSGEHLREEPTMGFGKGALLWLLGIPLPIILLLALFWR
jgi:hypothetical protein